MFEGTMVEDTFGTRGKIIGVFPEDYGENKKYAVQWEDRDIVSDVAATTVWPVGWVNS